MPCSEKGSLWDVGVSRVGADCVVSELFAECATPGCSVDDTPTRMAGLRSHTCHVSVASQGAGRPRTVPCVSVKLHRPICPTFYHAHPPKCPGHIRFLPHPLPQPPLNSSRSEARRLPRQKRCSLCRRRAASACNTSTCTSPTPCHTTTPHHLPPSPTRESATCGPNTQTDQKSSAILARAKTQRGKGGDEQRRKGGGGVGASATSLVRPHPA